MILLKKKYKIGNFFRNLSRLSFLNKILSKIIFFNLKYSNYFLNNYEYIKRKDYTHSYPTIISLNTTNLCNYRCTFCEIHYFYDFAKKTAGKIFPNNIDSKFIKKFDDLFNHIFSIELSGASGEPLLNLNFLDICKKFKEKNIELSVTTNGSMLNKNTAENLINMKFNHTMISLHSGEEKNYFELQGGNFNTVIKNLEYLIKLKKKKSSNLPKVSINCLVFKLNKHFIKKLIKKIKEIGIDEMNINQYYASRNKINQEVSFYFNPKEGNDFLREIYQYANNINLKLKPEKPEFIDIDKSVSKQNNDYICEAPWNSLKFKGCVEFEYSHYVAVCNRIILFRINYDEFEGNFIKDIWNHEIIRYFRKNVMKNPICQFCRNPNTLILRCLDNRAYQVERDIAVKKFLNSVIKEINVKQKKGIFLLNENPYKYVNYYEKSKD